MPLGRSLLNRIFLASTLRLTSVALLVAALSPARVCSYQPVSQQVLGPLGAAHLPLPTTPLPEAARLPVPNTAFLRQVLTTQLSPAGETVVIYDSTPEEIEPHPQIAIVVDGNMVEQLDLQEITGVKGGLVQYLGSAKFRNRQGVNGLALAVSWAGDGAGSAFAVLQWRAGRYQVAFHVSGSQARLAIAPGWLTMWTSEGDGPCVWCPQHYGRRRFVLREGGYTEERTRTLRRHYHPSEISGTPLRCSE